MVRYTKFKTEEVLQKGEETLSKREQWVNENSNQNIDTKIKKPQNLTEKLKMVRKN